MVGSGIVKIDRPLNKTLSQYLGVEIEILLRVGRHTCDVMDALDSLHVASLTHAIFDCVLADLAVSH